jgi:hypothetical protein
VQDAANQLAKHNEGRGADVYMTFLPDQDDGSKMGADDYLLEHTLRELQLLMRPYDPADFTHVRLSRDERLRHAIRDLRSRWWGFDWSRVIGTSESGRPNSMRGHSCRDLAKVGIDEAARSGEVVVDGVRFTLSTRVWALRAATSRQTAMKGIAHLEAEGLLRRDYGDKAEDAPGSYVLLTACSSLDHDGKKHGQEGEATQRLQAFDPGGQGLSTPRLRWSAPTFDREGDRLVRGYVHRLGKQRGAIIDVLVKEGPMDINEVAEALQASRVSNLRRSLLRLQEAEIVAVDGDKVSLSPNWGAALEEERKLKGEIRNDAGEDGAEERDRGRYRLQSEAYREWLKLSPEERKALKDQRARARADGFIKDLRLVDEPEEQQREREISPLATAIRDYLQSNPHDACQPPGWLGTTLWAFDLYPDKPTPAQARAAVDELGGETYLRHTLERAKGAA